MSPIQASCRTLLLGVAVIASSPCAAQAQARQKFDIKAGPLSSAIKAFVSQTGEQLLVPEDMLAHRRSPGVTGLHKSSEALILLLQGSGLEPVRSRQGVIYLRQKPQKQLISQTEVSPAARLAQPVPEIAPVDDTSSNEIVVTAQRREELPQDVPITLTAIGSEQLRQSGANSISSISKMSPGVRFDNQYANAQPSIRGVGSALSGAGVGSNVAIYVDGFYIMDPTASDFDILSVENIQILKGPQGTLFGRNSTGGAILVNSTKPSQDTRVTAQASYGSFDALGIDGYATTGLGDKLAVDVAGQYRRGDGFLRNIVTGSKKDGAYEKWTARVGVKFDPTDSLSLLFRYSHSDFDDPASVNYNAFSENGRALVLGAVVPGVIVATKPNEVASNILQPAAEYRSNAYQLTAQLNADWADVTSYTQYRTNRGHSDFSIDRSSANFFFIVVPSTDRLFSQELIVASKGTGPLKWTAGAFFMDNKSRFPNVVGSVSNGPLTLASTTATETTSLAGFADATYQVAPKLFLTGGIRYTHEELKNVSRFEGPLGGGSGLILYPDQTYNGLTPRAVVRYKVNEKSSIFASFAQGAKAPVANTSGASFVQVKPEKLLSYEIGYKYNDRRLSFDLSSYYYDYKDLQIIVPSTDGATAYVINAASSRIYGVEGQIRYQFSPHFDFNAGVAYTNAKYKKFPNSQIFIQCLSPSCGAAFGTFPPATIDASGFPMARAPKFSGNASGRYTADLAGGKLLLNAELFYTSKIYFDSSRQFAQSGYATLGLGAEWTDPSGHYSLSVRGDNVTDKRYRTQVIFGPLGQGSTWNYPATVTGTVRVKY